VGRASSNAIAPGNQAKVNVPNDDGQFNEPHGVAVDSSGNVYVSDSGNNRIQKFSSDGTFITKWGSRGSSNGQFIGVSGSADEPGPTNATNGQFNEPHGVAVDSSGNVYVAEGYNNRLQKFSSDPF
jgi:tripartite motif-containing protein 71